MVELTIEEFERRVNKHVENYNEWAKKHGQKELVITKEEMIKSYILQGVIKQYSNEVHLEKQKQELISTSNKILSRR